ncbi:metallophosphoesterase [Chitinophaga sp. CF418]|uniref:metallophosphoesterase family protein n=1 Tax=Chitinophaga sp. CF418 TaxID=1855287 RepID=UPI0009217C42|nr:metallophosphoesterase [Chitinophaga sp. CF418]SHN45377.1 Calcineurin-like phosphoesterase [Chitinophaga sp. CF418]
MQRRSLFKKLGGLLLAPAIPFGTIAAAPRNDKPVLRIAHLTDVHLYDKAGAPDHFRKCLHHVQSQEPKVDMILNGGDIVFDMNKENLSTIDAQWKLLHTIMKNECSLPVYYTLGNHDIWWHEDSKGQAAYGKKYSMGQLQLSLPYYSFVKGGWKFIILDSVHLDIDDTWYIGKLGDEQMHWLEGELKSTDPAMPVCVLSHIPILTATLMVEDNVVNRWQMLGGEMHTDVAKIIRLFYQHPNVKLCLSGHIHLKDKVVYNNVTYLCNGAVSGAWWKGNNRETAPGYGLIELFANGDFTERYVNYQV